MEQESGGEPNPALARRYEHGFLKRYIVPLNLPLCALDTPTAGCCESHDRSTSWGVMQMMGESYRELGGDQPILDTFLNINNQAYWGCRWLARKLAYTNGDVHAALQLWNGGGNPNYADEVLARMATYQAVLVNNNANCSD